MRCSPPRFACSNQAALSCTCLISAEEPASPPPASTAAFQTRTPVARRFSSRPQQNAKTTRSQLEKLLLRKVASSTIEAIVADLLRQYRSRPHLMRSLSLFLESHSGTAFALTARHSSPLVSSSPPRFCLNIATAFASQPARAVVFAVLLAASAIESASSPRTRSGPSPSPSLTSSSPPKSPRPCSPTCAANPSLSRAAHPETPQYSRPAFLGELFPATLPSNNQPLSHSGTDTNFQQEIPAEFNPPLPTMDECSFCRQRREKSPVPLAAEYFRKLPPHILCRPLAAALRLRTPRPATHAG